MSRFLALVVTVSAGVATYHALSPVPAPLGSLAAVIAPAIDQSAAVEPVPVPQPASERQVVKAKPLEPKPVTPAEPRTGRKPDTERRPPTVPSEANVPLPVPPRHVQLAEASERKPVTRVSSPEADHEASAELARSIQTHLQRVGCYAGPINGKWTEASRDAMKDFNARVNASLPVGSPDPVLLALLEGYKDKACGRLCPPGETQNAAGLCVRNDVSARRKETAPAPPATAQRPLKRPEFVESKSEARPKTAQTVEPWRTTVTNKAPVTSKAPVSQPVQTVRPGPSVPAPTIVASARKELNQAKEAEQQRTVAPPPMALGLKPAPPDAPLLAAPVPPAITVPEPQPVLAPTARPAPRVAARAVPDETDPALTAVQPPPRQEALRTPAEARHVRRAPAAPAYRSTTSYSNYLRSGAIWKKFEQGQR